MLTCSIRSDPAVTEAPHKDTGESDTGIFMHTHAHLQTNNYPAAITVLSSWLIHRTGNAMSSSSDKDAMMRSGSPG